MLAAHTKSEDEFRLLTDIDGNNNTSKEDDLENQLSCQFERVLQGIKSRDQPRSQKPGNEVGLCSQCNPL